MAIYDAGTASLAANGTVTGTGTTWQAPLTLIRVGATIVFKTEPVKIYTISEIISDTQINVYNPKSETVQAGTGYAILAHDGITVQGLAQDVAETLRYYQSRETEVADAVDAFNNFDANDFDNKVTQVNTQHGEVVNIGAQVATDAAQVTADKDSAAASAASASSDKDAAAASAQEAADYAASLDTQNLLRKDLNFSDVEDKAVARLNIDVYSKSQSIGKVGGLNELRLVEPVVSGQVVYVSGYSSLVGIGGGAFFYDDSDTASPDDDGVTIVTASGKRWKRVCTHISTDYYGLVAGDESVDAAAIINKALVAATSAREAKVVVSKGAFYTTTAIKMPSGVTLCGSGVYATAIIASPSMPIITNVVQNSKYAYKQFGTDYNEDIRIENIVLDGNNRARNTTETWMDATQGTTVMFTTVRNCVLDRVWVRRSLQHGIDIAAGYYFNDGNINNEPVGGSYDVVVKDCIGQNTQLDDVFTCHNSRRLKFIRCKAWNDDPSMVWGSNQHGFEIDDGCSDVIVRDCYAQNFVTGFQQKGHDSTMPARNVVFDNCIAEDCVMSFQVEHRNTSTIPSGQVHNARSSRIVNCTSINANNSKQPSIHARAILIDGFHGVFVNNLRIKGGAGNIYLSRGASNVYIDGVYCDGGYTGATDSTSEGIVHVETNANCNNYHISNITVSDEISVPVVRDLTDSIQVRRSITNITAKGSNATIPFILVTLGSGDTINGLQTLGSWKCAVRDAPRSTGSGDYSSTVSFLNGVSTETGSGNPNNGIVCCKAGSLYIDVGTGDRYHGTGTGLYYWVKVSTS